jgi:hypothetical protein
MCAGAVHVRNLMLGRCILHENQGEADSPEQTQHPREQRQEEPAYKPAGHGDEIF